MNEKRKSVSINRQDAIDRLAELENKPTLTRDERNEIGRLHQILFEFALANGH